MSSSIVPYGTLDQKLVKESHSYHLSSNINENSTTCNNKKRYKAYKIENEENKTLLNDMLIYK